MTKPEITESIRRKFQAVRPFLDERARRVWAAAEAAAFGRGGVTLVARATGLARSTLYEGQGELREQQPSTLPARRVRRPVAQEAPAPACSRPATGLRARAGTRAGSLHQGVGWMEPPGLRSHVLFDAFARSVGTGSRHVLPGFSAAAWDRNPGASAGKARLPVPVVAPPCAEARERSYIRGT